MRNWLHPHRKFGYSLLEVSVSMLIFGSLLMMAATSLPELVAEKRRLNDRQQAFRLARNLTETLLALPLDEAKHLDPNKTPLWTAHRRYTIQTRWESDRENPYFERLTVAYLRSNRPLIRLSVLHRESSSGSH